jgi:hypothetical protein
MIVVCFRGFTNTFRETSADPWVDCGLRLKLTLTARPADDLCTSPSGLVDVSLSSHKFSKHTFVFIFRQNPRRLFSFFATLSSFPSLLFFISCMCVTLLCLFIVLLPLFHISFLFPSFFHPSIPSQFFFGFPTFVFLLFALLSLTVFYLFASLSSSVVFWSFSQTIFPPFFTSLYAAFLRSLSTDVLEAILISDIKIARRFKTTPQVLRACCVILHTRNVFECSDIYFRLVPANCYHLLADVTPPPAPPVFSYSERNLKRDCTSKTATIQFLFHCCILFLFSSWFFPVCSFIFVEHFLFTFLTSFFVFPFV